MADFISDFGGSLGDKVLPNGDALKRKIDYQRDTFLKGVSSTKHGKKEDPTYLHFRFIFDFGDTSFLDAQTFLPPSPLFRETTTDQSAITNVAASDLGNPNEIISDSLYLDKLRQYDNAANGTFYTDTDFFYGSKFLINSRAQKGAFSMNDSVGYLGAPEFLGRRSVKRKQMITAFKNGLKYINEKCPYYFQSISGLDQLLKVDIKNLHKAAGKPQRSGTLIIDCLESIDMRMFSLSELYRKAIYDYTHHRVMLPENLRKFRMWLVVSEIRNIQLSYGVNDILNPFSVPSVAQASNFLDSFNSQTGLLNNTEGILQKSTNGSILEPQDKFGSYTLGPYAFIYQFDQCEFDFDDSYPSFATIDNKGGSAVNSRFKIHVGRVRDYKIQFNLLADLINKDDNIKSMVLSDSWGSNKNPYDNYDYFDSQGIASLDLSSTGDPAEYFSQLASNFITNSVSDLKEQGVSIVQGALLGNIYGAGGVNTGSALRSASSVVNTVQGFVENGVPNPFADNTPQARGLGGPGQRQYPTVNEDVYTNNPSSSQQNLGGVYPDTASNPAVLNEDIYPTNPGTSLGLPDREYPIPGGDEYSSVPGQDLGVPGRVYPIVQGDLYPTNPGVDGGLPDRPYPVISDDVYPDPIVVNTSNIGDVYPDENILYPPINETVYDDPQQINTNNIGDVYPNEDNQYGSVNDNEYDIPQVNPIENIGDVYADQQAKYPEVNERVYNDSVDKEEKTLEKIYNKKNIEYPGVNEDLYKNAGGFSRGINEDVYKTVPGRDLGTPDRNYDSLNDNIYPGKNPTIDTNRIGRVYPKSDNENN